MTRGKSASLAAHQKVEWTAAPPAAAFKITIRRAGVGEVEGQLLCWSSFVVRVTVGESWQTFSRETGRQVKTGRGKKNTVDPDEVQSAIAAAEKLLFVEAFGVPRACGEAPEVPAFLVPPLVRARPPAPGTRYGYHVSARLPFDGAKSERVTISGSSLGRKVEVCFYVPAGHGRAVKRDLLALIDAACGRAFAHGAAEPDAGARELEEAAE